MGFYYTDVENVKIMRSSLLDKCNIKHGFSTRLGGVSEAVHTSSMNIAFGRGDDNETVIKNVEIFLTSVGINPKRVISVPQIHSKDVLSMPKGSAEDYQGFGVYRETDIALDGYVTDSDKIAPMIKIADCAPVLMCDPVNRIVSAVHSGWKGTAMGISKSAVDNMLKLGAVRKNIVCAIGPCIHKCCYEVGADFFTSVADMRGYDFADRFITPLGEKYFADIVGMIVYDLNKSGIDSDNIDISDECTCCNPVMFHSHRASKGIRGTMGAVISL